MSNKQPTMTVFAGTNGAGKSTLSRQMGDVVGTVIDPDRIAKELCPENPRSTDLTAGREAVKRVRGLISANENFAIETTLSGSFALRHMQMAKERSYLLVLYYIGLQDVQMHIDRVASRVEQGGHWISEKDIRWRYGQSLQSLGQALSIADEVYIIDNTDKPVVVAEIERGKLLRSMGVPPSWAMDVLVGYRL
ncbi:zeta toxin family protein [Cohnella cellulosilytica]|uniref:UDP-N-acetylglucosamine kinase n=2 Tax=Cohnella cellulosilytica TaxID=986710 RepID=A0ABW2F8G2_9BACL